MISKLINPVQKFVTDNTPVILTGAGVAGVVATTVLTGKATIKATQIVTGEYADRVDKFTTQTGSEPTSSADIEKPTKQEVAQLVWKEYIPVAGAFSLTIFCIVAANRLSAKEAAALAAAYGLSQDHFAEYREKVKTSFGDGKERKVREEVAQDGVTKNPPPSSLIISSNSKVLCKDEFSDRYFESDVESIRKAVNDFNQQLQVEMEMSLSDFYHMIGIKTTGYSDLVGWTSSEPLDIDLLTALTDDNRVCIVMHFAPEPRHKIDLYR